MESPLPPNPYKTLNVAKDASLATIRSAHRKLVLTCHPDKIKDEGVKEQKAEQFHQVQQAYEILSDETRRQRYDERVKLAELRAEMMAEKGGSRGISEIHIRSGPSPIFEVRGDRVYEERFPSRFHEEDVFGSTFQEHRSTSKKYDDYYSPSSVRRSSGRLPDERRKGRDLDDNDRLHKHAMKEAEKKANYGHQKKKDKDKRKDREAKFSRKSAYVEDGEDSDSDVTERNGSSRHDPTPKHRHEEFWKRDREEAPRRGSRREELNAVHDTDLKIYGANVYEVKAHVAMDYIQKSRGGPIEIELRRPSTSGRHFSAFEGRPSLVQPLASADTGRRSGRARESRKSSPIRKERIPEIVESAPRKVSIPTGSSDPHNLKHTMHSARKESFRAPTMDAFREDRHAPLRRADSMPIQGQRRNEHISAPSSRLRGSEMNDSDRSSPERYQGTSPPFKTRKHHVHEDDENAATRRFFHVIPADGYRERERDRERDRERERDISPKSHRPADRPSASRAPSTPRVPQRSMSYASYPVDPLSSPRPPPLSRADTARPLPPQGRQSSRALYGELSQTEGYKVVHQLPQIRRDDIRYSPQSPRDTGRESYPYEPSRNRPAMQRHETRAVY
jgi:curved DNA-binding protein CbpA